MEERMIIYKESNRNKKLLLNRRYHIYGTCRHNVYFHHYVWNTKELTRCNKKELICQEIL